MKPGAKRLKGAPREVGPVWSLTDHEMDRFDRANGVTHAFKQLHPAVHPDDRELLFNALAGALGFHELSKVIDQLEFAEAVEAEELQSELQQVRVAFELTLQALDRALDERASTFDEKRRAALRRHALDPKQEAKAFALELWKERHAGRRPDLRTVAQFATEVMRQREVLQSAKVIEAWSAKWSKQVRSGQDPSC